MLFKKILLPQQASPLQSLRSQIIQCLSIIMLAALVLEAGCAVVPPDGPAGKSPSASAGKVSKEQVAELTKLHKIWPRQSFADLPGWQSDELLAARPAWLQSCRTSAMRAQWTEVCVAIEAFLPEQGQAAFRLLLESLLVPWQVKSPDGAVSGLLTGYYEPFIKASLTPRLPQSVPVYGMPNDLLQFSGSNIPEVLQDYEGVGRRNASGAIVPYYSRAEIAARANELKPAALLYADDPVELFFLHVQGSGQVLLDDGRHMRLRYAGKNGWRYRSIGRWLVDQGELDLSSASMHNIHAWAAKNPQRMNELLNANPRYIFFTLESSLENGPIGALGVPLTAARSIAVDPTRLPLGAPVYIRSQWPNSSIPLQRLVLAQDVGSAIKGDLRADFFWGSGDDAGDFAGRMKQTIEMSILLPKGKTPEMFD